MIKYLKESFRRKAARRHTQKYPLRLDVFTIKGIGNVNFYNWENPLVHEKILTKENIDFFAEIIKSGDIAVDIGANIGHYSVCMAICCSENGKLIAFDPNPFVYEILEKNAQANGQLYNILPFNNAIADVEGEYYYHSSEASFNNGGISTQPKSRHGKYRLGQKIKAVNFESFIEKQIPGESGKIKLIKIDTEGYDKEILKSISGFLQKYHPVVISECFGDNDEKVRFEHFEILNELGYSLFYFCEFKSKTRMIPIVKKEDMLRWRHFDFIAKPN